jgi:hypothetical protein
MLDYNGVRAFHLFRFDELGKPLFQEASAGSHVAQAVQKA